MSIFLGIASCIVGISLFVFAFFPEMIAYIAGVDKKYDWRAVGLIMLRYRRKADFTALQITMHTCGGWFFVGSILINILIQNYPLCVYDVIAAFFFFRTSQNMSLANQLAKVFHI